MLHKLQEQFRGFVLSENDEPVDCVISPNALERLRVYRNNYFGNLIAALRITYPMFYNLVGEAFFESCAKRYIKQNPPPAMDLIEYGLDFHEFIRSMDVPPYFSDLVKLEALRDICHHTGENQSMVSCYNIHEVYEFCKAEDPDAKLDLAEGEYSFVVYRDEYFVKVKLAF